MRNKIGEDDFAYWSQHKLPVHRWQLHGSMIARHDDAAHALLRQAYYEIDRVQLCIDNQREGVMGEVFLPEGSGVKTCDAAKALAAIGDALDILETLLGTG